VNAAGGLVGVESGVVGTSGLGFTSMIVCFSNLPEKIASAVDGQADDSNPASGQVRAQLQTSANPDTAAAPGISAYVETGVNQYLLCKNF
jgi:formiminotetrahydrofolate cyclodeaminase